MLVLEALADRADLGMDPLIGIEAIYAMAKATLPEFRRRLFRKSMDRRRAEPEGRLAWIAGGADDPCRRAGLRYGGPTPSDNRLSAYTAAWATLRASIADCTSA